MLLSASPDAGRPAPQRLYVLDGVFERVRRADFMRLRRRPPHLWSDLPERLTASMKRTLAETLTNGESDGAPDPKRRKVQNSIADLREQAEKAGFTPEDVQLFDQPYHDMCGELEHANEISYICEHGAPTERWGKNFRKLSVQNVEDKPAHRRRDPCVDLNPSPETAQPCDCSGGDDDDDSDGYDSDDVDTGGQVTIVEVDDEDAPVDRTVQINGSASHLYSPAAAVVVVAQPQDEAGPSSPKPNNTGAGKIITPNKAHARAAMQLATRDIDNVVSAMLRPPDAKMSIFTRFLLSSMQPRRNMKVRLIIEDKTTGERKQVVRSVPHYLDSLKATANDPGTNGGGGGGDQQSHQVVPAVHMHTRKWEENWLLRTPIAEWGERPCIKGEQCQGYAYCFDTKRALREYVSPREHAHWMTFGVWPHLGQPARQCLMCKRYGVSMDYWSSRAARRSANPTNQLLAEFYNLVNVPGEYHIGQCECNPGPYMGLWGPVAKHHLPNYTPVVTTLGAMIGRGELMPSVAFKSQLPDHVLHRLEVVLFAQTGFVQIRESEERAVSTSAEGASLISGREGAFISGSAESIVAHFLRGRRQ